MSSSILIYFATHQMCQLWVSPTSCPATEKRWDQSWQNHFCSWTENDQDVFLCQFECNVCIFYILVHFLDLLLQLVKILPHLWNNLIFQVRGSRVALAEGDAVTLICRWLLPSPWRWPWIWPWRSPWLIDYMILPMTFAITKTLNMMVRTSM